MHAVERHLESMIKKQLDAFIEKHNLIPENMHGTQKSHSTITANLQIDEEINLQKVNRRKVALLNTDLTATYETISHPLILNKSEHLEIIGK